MSNLKNKLMEMGANSSDAEKISEISSRKDAISKLLQIKDVRLKSGEKAYQIEDKMKSLGIYYEFKG